MNIKTQLWEDVCAIVIHHWGTLEGANKTNTSKLKYINYFIVFVHKTQFSIF